MTIYEVVMTGVLIVAIVVLCIWVVANKERRKGFMEFLCSVPEILDEAIERQIERIQYSNNWQKMRCLGCENYFPDASRDDGMGCRKGSEVKRSCILNDYNMMEERDGR